MFYKYILIILRSSQYKYGCGIICIRIMSQKYLKGFDMKLSFIYIFIIFKINIKFFNMNKIFILLIFYDIKC